MRYKETIKRGISLLLALLLAVSLIVPAAAVDGGRGAEMVAAFDQTSYSAGETVTVTFMVYGADFDAAGFHVTYDQNQWRRHRPGADRRGQAAGIHGCVSVDLAGQKICQHTGSQR